MDQAFGTSLYELGALYICKASCHLKLNKLVDTSPSLSLYVPTKPTNYCRGIGTGQSHTASKARQNYGLLYLTDLELIGSRIYRKDSSAVVPWENVNKGLTFSQNSLLRCKCQRQEI